MMQAAEQAARAAMLEAAQREGIPLGPWSASSKHQQVQLDDQQLQFINELEQSSSNGEISNGDQHLLHEVMGLHQGQINFQIAQPVEPNPAPLQYQQAAQPHFLNSYQLPSDDSVQYHGGVHEQMSQDYFRQFLQQQQSFDENQNSYPNETFSPSLPHDHYLTIAQNGKCGFVYVQVCFVTRSYFFSPSMCI
jgi:hypothetical protein